MDWPWNVCYASGKHPKHFGADLDRGHVFNMEFFTDFSENNLYISMKKSKPVKRTDIPEFVHFGSKKLFESSEFKCGFIRGLFGLGRGICTLLNAV